jgi:hypothetical protein
MIGVKGWYSANCLMPAFIVSAGTNALLRNGSMISGTVARPADSTDLAARPMATVSQAVPKASSSISPTAASQSSRLPCERNPIAKPTPTMAASAIRLRTVVATTWPVRTAPRETSMVLNRLMTPLVMSSLTEVAVGPRP